MIARTQSNSLPRGLLVVSLIVVVLYGAAAARNFFVPVCIAALVAFLMAPIVRFLRRHRWPELASIPLAVVILVLPFSLIGFLFVRQAMNLLNEFPAMIAWTNRTVTGLVQSPFGQKYGLAQHLSHEAMTARLAEGAGQGITLAISGMRTLLDVGSQTILIVLFAILMVASREHLRRASEHILATFENLRAASLLDDVTGLIQQFLTARLTIVAIISALAMGGLWIFGLQYSFLIGIFTGLMTLVPAVGFIAALVLTLTVALATGHGGFATLMMGAMLLALNILENNLLTPKMVGHRLNINALSTFLGFFAGGLLWGVWGMFLSLPLLGILRIAFSAAPTLEPWGELLAERHTPYRLPQIVTKKRVARELGA